MTLKELRKRFEEADKYLTNENAGKILSIKTEKDFNEFNEWLNEMNFDESLDYELYNAAFVQLYGHEPFDDDGNFKTKESWREMNNGNVELYYAMINVLDWYGKRNMTDWDVGMTVQRILEDLECLSEDNTPSVVGDANDCGECRRWSDVMKGFREQWKNGERE